MMKFRAVVTVPGDKEYSTRTMDLEKAKEWASFYTKKPGTVIRVFERKEVQVHEARVVEVGRKPVLQETSIEPNSGIAT